MRAAATALALLMLVAIGSTTLTAQSSSEPQYEMDHYVVGLLKKGPKWTPEVTAETQKIQEGHLANIRRMASLGILTVAGPFEENGDLRGMFIFTCSPEQARREVAEDPAVKAGRLILELHPWFAAKGIKVNPPK